MTEDLSDTMLAGLVQSAALLQLDSLLSDDWLQQDRERGAAILRRVTAGLLLYVDVYVSKTGGQT